MNKSLYIVVLRSTRLQSSGLQTYSMITMELGIVYKKNEFGDFLGEGIVLSLSVSYFYESGKAKNFVK